MKILSIVAMVVLAAGPALVSAVEQKPMAVSPNSDVGIAVVGQVAPTFSWTAVEGAAGYRLEVFAVSGDLALPHKDMAAQSYPVITKEIRGAATSWTPSREEQLGRNSEYVWYVQALDDQGNGSWSQGAVFRIEAAPTFAAIEESVGESLKEHGVAPDVIEDVLSRVRSETEKSLQSQEINPGLIAVQGLEGTDNTFYGNNAGAAVTTGQYNTFIGAYAGTANTSANSNTFVGQVAGYGNTLGIENTFVGRRAGYSNTTGNYNTYLGVHAGESNVSGDENTFLGWGAGRSNTLGIFNVFIGSQTGVDNTEGGSNTFVGHWAGKTNTTGAQNTFLGDQAGTFNWTGSGNVLLGSNTGINNITGANNTCVGTQAGFSLTAGINNTFLGQGTGYSTLGDGNVFLGFKAGYNETGSNKLYIENTDSSSPLIYGEFDNDIVALMGTVGIGTLAPAFPMEMKKSGVNASIVIDRTDGATNYINATDTFGNFGTVTNHALRLVANSVWRMRLDTDNSLRMKSGATCTSTGVWTNASSRDLKENIECLSALEAEDALDALDPVKYNYKTDREDSYLGFIAEDVPELVASKDRKGMSAMDIVAVLTKVLQEQKRVVEEQRRMNAEQQKVIKELQAQIEELKKK